MIVVAPNGRTLPNRDAYLAYLIASAAGLLRRAPTAHLIAPIRGDQAGAIHLAHPSSDRPSLCARIVIASGADGVIYLWRGLDELGIEFVTGAMLPHAPPAAEEMDVLLPHDVADVAAVLDALRAALHLINPCT